MIPSSEIGIEERCDRECNQNELHNDASAELRLKSLEERFAEEAVQQSRALHLMEERFAQEVAEKERAAQIEAEKSLEERLASELATNERATWATIQAEEIARERFLQELAEKDHALRLESEEWTKVERDAEIRLRGEEQQINASLRLAIQDNATLTKELEKTRKEFRNLEVTTEAFRHQLNQNGTGSEIDELRLKSSEGGESEIQARVTHLRSSLGQATDMHRDVTFRTGEHIRAKYQRYWDATITRINLDGTVIVKWDDNDHVDTVKSPDQIRGRSEIASALPLIRVGALVEAEYSGWYRATVKEINGDGSYTLDWADDDKRDRIKWPKDMQKLGVDDEIYSVGEHIHAMHVRYCDATIEAINSDGTVRVTWADNRAGDRTKKRSQIRSNIGYMTPALKVGASIQAEAHEWHRAIVEKVVDNGYIVSWQDHEQRERHKKSEHMRKLRSNPEARFP